jgi:hypothetical protein
MDLKYNTPLTVRLKSGASKTTAMSTVTETKLLAKAQKSKHSQHCFLGNVGVNSEK